MYIPHTHRQVSCIRAMDPALPFRQKQSEIEMFSAHPIGMCVHVRQGVCMCVWVSGGSGERGG